MTNAFQKLLLAAAGAVLVTLPLGVAAEAAPRHKPDRQHAAFKHDRGPVHLAARRHRGDVRTPLINQRIANQARRIEAGIARGRLTRIEALRLRGRLAAIRTSLRFARMDGDVTMGERRRILAMLDANSSRIARLAQNRRFR